MTPPIVVLAFDTSGPWCVAGVLRGDDVIASLAEPMQKGQAEALMPLLQSLIADAGLAFSDLAAIAVGTGPGNFTGVRIGVSAARGLALGLGIPAIGVTRFQAEAGPRATGPIAVSLLAPRGHAYLQLLDGLAAASAPQTLDLAASPRPALPTETPIVGYRADRLGHSATPYDPDARIDDLAARIARTAALVLATGTPQPRPAPLYVRAADAAPPRDPAPLILP